MANLEELRTRLAFIAESDSPLVRIELAPIEAAELLEALPDPVDVSDELDFIADLVSRFSAFAREGGDRIACRRVIRYLEARYA